MPDQEPPQFADRQANFITNSSHELDQSLASKIYREYFAAMTALTNLYPPTHLAHLRTEYGRVAMEVRVYHSGGKRAIKIERQETQLDDRAARSYADYFQVDDPHLLLESNPTRVVRLLFEENNTTGELVEIPHLNEQEYSFMQSAVKGFSILSQEEGAQLEICMDGQKFMSKADGREVKFTSNGREWIPNVPHQPATPILPEKRVLLPTSEKV